MIMSPDLTNRRLVVAFGRCREDMVWTNSPQSFGALIERLSKFRRGAKNGAALTQGELVSGRRLAKNVVRNHILMVDCDTGETLDELEAKIRNQDLCALLWTTYSHMKPFTHVAESKFAAWARKQGIVIDDSNRVDHMKRYLQSTEKVKQSILDTITCVDRKLAEGGVRFVVHHDAMPRARALFILSEPFEFVVDHVSQESRINEWKEKYTGFCKVLGLAFDKSCVDPSRLMYMASMAPDANPELHEARWIDGGVLDFQNVPNASDLPDDDDPLSAFSNVQVPSGRLELKTPGLAAFLKAHGHEFHAAEFMRHHEHMRSDSDGKIECECPNDDAHSNSGDPNDRAFFATDCLDGGWTMRCQHDSCITESSVHNPSGKPDRAWFLDRACQKYGIKHASELTQFTETGHNNDERGHHSAETNRNTLEALRREIEGLNSETDGAVVDHILRRLAEHAPSTTIEQLLKRIAEKVSISLTVLRSTMLTFGRARRTAATEEDNTLTSRHVPSEDEIRSGASTVWAQWGHDQQIRTAKKILEHNNKRRPNIYRKLEGGLVRVSFVDGMPRLEEINSCLSSVWASELNRTVVFKRLVDGAEEVVAPFSNVVAELVGSNSIDLPVIASVSTVPVFAEDGSIETEPGYNAKTRCYLHPNASYRPIPLTPAEDDVNRASALLLEPLRDFPFTDKFDGSDALPIREDELDPEGFPYPNWTRGYVSRLHALAMILQPFARNLIKGPCPIYHVDKSAAGTGAGYLVDISQIFFTGQRAEVGTMNHNAEEFRKEITATLRRGTPTIFIDNINHHVDDAGLAAALTAGTWKGRILGKSEEVAIPIHATWIMAGNNLSFSSELMRRICPIRMDAAVPDPAVDRPIDFYKHQDIHQWCIDNRVDLVWACHVLIQHWIAKEKPNGACAISSFTHWSRTMSGILEAAGYPGFMETRDEYRAMKNEEQSSLDKFAEFLVDTFGDAPFTVKEAFDASLDDCRAAGGVASFGGTPQFRFTEIPLAGKDDHARVCALGKFFTKSLVGKAFRLENGTVLKLTKLPMKRNAFYRFVAAVASSSNKGQSSGAAVRTP